MRVSQFLIIREISILATAIIALFAGGAAAQSGGQFSIEQTVIATGGATVSSGGGFTLGGTTGQSIAGQKAANQPFSLHAGFWTAAQAFAPTAATVNLGGRLVTTSGLGIRNARVVLTMPGGETRIAISGTFGYYRFPGVPAGETYILTASAKRFTFSAPTQIVSLFEDRDDVNFIADESFLR